MKTPNNISPEQRKNLSGRGGLILMWLLGVPLPIILLVWMFHG